MATILYPTRAGDSAHRNQDRVIEMAREQGASLLLLYVSNVHFLDHIAGPKHVEIVEAELDELGAFLLAMAQERAEKANIEVESVLRHGGFRLAVIDVIKEHGVTSVVLGHPTHTTANTTVEFISEFARTLAVDCNVDVHVVHEGEIVDHFKTTGDSVTADP